MTRICRACPQPHPIYMQAEPDWYRPSVGEQIKEAIGCAAQMAGILIAAVVVWLTVFALFALVTG